MAGRGNLANLKPFKPGHSGNPAGRAGVLPPEIRKARKNNQAALIYLVSELMSLPDEKYEERAKNPETPQMERAVQALIGKSREGDVQAFKYLMELITGKIPEHDYDGFTEEDIRILNRVKEVISEQQRVVTDASGTGH